MTSIRELARNINRIDTQQLQRQVIEDTADKPIELNQDQLLQGKDSIGDDLKAYRDPFYASFKQTLNPRPSFGIADLRLKGRFFSLFKLIPLLNIEGIGAKITSTDEKSKRLESKYGQNIFGLNKSNTEKYQIASTKEYVRRWKKLAGL